jgi:hypothetical protein
LRAVKIITAGRSSDQRDFERGFEGSVRWVIIPNWLVLFVDAALAALLLLILGKLLVKAMADAVEVWHLELQRISKAWKMLTRKFHVHKQPTSKRRRK